MAVGKYHLLEKLGAGYFGTTYKAIDTIAEVEVAVKIIIKTWFNEVWFRKEVTPLIRIQHRNIIRYIECNYVGNGADRRWYVVTELANQGTLARRIGQLSSDTAISLCLAILEGLHAAHSNNIIHNDLKPENILVHDGCIKVADFGISKESNNTVIGEAEGTPLYMAPERHTASESSKKSDIWAVGVILYQMLTNRLPFCSRAEIVQYHPTPLKLEKEGVPRHLALILAKAMANAKNNRFADALSFYKALQETTIKGTNIMRAEQGIVGWDWDGQPYTHRKFEITFNKPFKTPPIIQVSLTMLDSWSEDDKATRVWCSSTNINKNTANIEVGTWQNNKIGGVKVQWTAMGE